jgi:adenine-specific DNA-methyltransferase
LIFTRIFRVFKNIWKNQKHGQKSFDFQKEYIRYNTKDFCPWDFMTAIQQTTQNISVPNADLAILKKHFSHCFDKNGKFNFEKFKTELAKNEIEFSKESYGLDWLGKNYARLLANDSATTLLKEDKEWNAKPENKNSENLLIKGDNLEVLKHLKSAYYEQVKMIYIDPPYNTGSDGFVYADDRKFTVQELSKLAGIDQEKAKRILDFTKSKSNSHSAWLTFLYPRLYIAKQLLRDDGVIFVSIDDNEVAQLRILMDEIFGEENFVAQFVWRKKYGGGKGSRFVVDLHEYILCFSKSINSIKDFSLSRTEEQKEIFSLKDEYFFDRGGYYIRPLKSGLAERKTLVYPIKSPDGSEVITQWICAENTFKELLNDGRIVFKKLKDGKYNVYKKFYENDNSGNVLPESILYDLAYNQNGKEEIKDLFSIKEGRDIIFENPKPTTLIKYFIQATNSNDLILDFFAGSGTTGDAVMQLNAEDGGNRKYILVQIAEPIDEKKNKTAYDFVKSLSSLTPLKKGGSLKDGGIDYVPTIFEITKERLIRAAKKIQAEQKKTPPNLPLSGEEKKGGLDLGFKIFETVPIWEKYEFEAEEHHAEQRLFEGLDLTPEDIQTLLTTWKTANGIALTVDLQTIDLGGYTGYYAKKKLYLMDKGFQTKHLTALLEKIDSDKTFEPNTLFAFGLHFESKVLREVSENVKNYANKKHLDIDFVIRY